MNSLIPIGIAAASGVAFFWEKIKPIYKNWKGDSEDSPPHAAVNQLITFFQKKKYPSGVDAAMNCGKQIYSALAEEGKQDELAKQPNKETK